MRITTLFFASSLFAVPSIASANIEVVFDEGAPKDRFTIINSSACAVEQGTLVIDLASSNGRLVFDTTGAGAGVEVFQPFEIVEGAAILTEQPSVTDGQQLIELSFARFDSGATIAFTIDVDDTIGAEEIIVTDAEIEGARFAVTSLDGSAEGVFSNQSMAKADWPAC